MGVFELEPFDEGTKVLHCVAAATQKVPAVHWSGDSASAIQKLGLEDKVRHISTEAALHWNSRRQKIQVHRNT